MAGWQDAPIVDDVQPSWKSAPIVGQDEPAKQADPEREVIATTDDGGVVYRGQDGALGFTSPSYATTDPAQIEKIMQGATPADVSRSGFDQQTIDQAPIASRAVKAVEGVPFVGSYVDEAAGLMFGDDAAQGVRALSGAMDRERPKESMALGLAGTVAGAVPLAVAAGPNLVAQATKTLGTRALQSGLLAAPIGAIEGALYGSGKQDDRVGNAQQGAIFGGIAGGVLGAAAPFAGEGIKRALTYLKGSDVDVIAKQLAISAPAARVVKRALDAGDMDAAAKAMERAGPDAMLADAGQPAAQLLDAAAATGGAAGRIAADAVDDRVTAAAGDLAQTLDRTFGKPSGLKAMAKRVRDETSGARSTAYDDAYSKPIDYAGGRGRMIENLLRRVPESAIKDANELMRINGEESAQILAKIGDDGKVTFDVLPDVRQIDYITRALKGVADKADGQGKLGGQTPLGSGYNALASNIRNALKGEVPEYAKALDVASDAISRVKAGELGYSLLRAGTKREDVARGLAGASKAERNAALEGIRTYIDDTLANVRTVITDPNGDAREAFKLLGDMSSRASKQKLVAVLGKKKAQVLFDELDTARVAFELRAALSANSKTAIRQSIQGEVKEQTAPGMFELLASGEPVSASRRFVQIFTGSTQEAQAIRSAGIYEEIATALSQTRGAKARSALKLVEKAMAGQRLTDQQAAFVGNTVAGSGFLAGSHTGAQMLSK